MNKTFIGLERVTWVSIAINVACFLINAYAYSRGANLASGLGMGFHIGLVLSCIMVDRIFFEATRREIQALEAIQAYLAKVKSLDHPKPTQGNTK